MTSLAFLDTPTLYCRLDTHVSPLYLSARNALRLSIEKVSSLSISRGSALIDSSLSEPNRTVLGHWHRDDSITIQSLTSPKEDFCRSRVWSAF